LVSRKVVNREVGTEGYLRLSNEQIPTAKLGTDPSATLRINQAETVYRGIFTWVSKHNLSRFYGIIVTPNVYQKSKYVDTAGTGWKKMPLPR